MVFHDTQQQVIDAKAEAVGGEPEPNLLGWSGWNTNMDNFYCEIHTVRPKRVDDNVTMTIGHEFVHCVYGRYHK